MLIIFDYQTFFCAPEHGIYPQVDGIYPGVTFMSLLR